MPLRAPFVWLFVLVLALDAATCLATFAAEVRRPNVVLLLADDQGWGDLSVHGNTNLATPNIDSLAAKGALFDRFYVCPVCSPTRAELLTGRYHPRGGVYDVTSGGERLNLDERTIADHFQAAGYVTAAFGKWHNGSQYPNHPLGRGFGEYYGFASGHWGDYFDPPLEHNGLPVRGRGFLVDDLTDRAIAFIEKHRDKPFFCYIPFNTPHSPMQVPDRFYQKFAQRGLTLRGRNPAAEDVAFTRAALAMCENIDWNVGRLLERLDALKLAEDTIVVYLSDNGPNSSRWNGGMKGAKGSTDEGGVRSPCLIRWPGHVLPGQRIAPIAGAIDLLPTLADLAGVKLAERPDHPLDGISLRPLLEGKTRDGLDRVIFSHWNGKVSARTDRFRLDSDGKLFDMSADPGQVHDVADKHSDEAQHLRKAIAGWKQEVLSGLKKEPRAFPVGYREMPLTQLPARDGVPHGQVKRSANAPNCSYFRDWARLEDRITWDIEVATPGRYEAVVYYACPAADVGSKIELSFRDRRVEATVNAAHDPPLLGAEHDRVPRKGESLVKDFRPMTLGVLDLPKGRDSLSLRALTVAGKQVMEVRSIHLTLQK